MKASEYKSHTDPELIALCLDGNALAWEALITRYRRLIYSVPVRFGFTTTDASDVFQSVCVILLEHLREVKDENKISAWLITTTTRECIHLKAVRTRETGTEDDYEEPLDPAENVEELQITTQQEQIVRESVGELPTRCRSLIEMLYFDARNLSYEEIAQQMGMPVASIGPTRARCLERLRKIVRRRGVK